MSIFKLGLNIIEKCKDFRYHFHPALKNILPKSPNKFNLSTKKNTCLLSKVLSIDEDKICQKIHVAHLEKLGCLVELVDTARAALEKLAFPYKIIFLDVNLPDCSSDTLVNLIRNDERNVNKDTPIIVTSSWLSESFIKKYLAIGINEVYIKPIISMDFKKILRTYNVIV